MAGKHKKEKENQNNNISIASQLLGNIPHFELTGNQEVVIEGSKGVLEYNDTVVRVNTGAFVATFNGRGLTMKCLTSSSLIIGGFFTSIEFVS
ncbi:MAG: YabP/YqfC family sporulation protein [Bacillota bacterium]|nr:YabP/YqfC family sporulation protein [Bacillota bacterium]